MFNDVATLVSKVNTGNLDENGDAIFDEVETDVFVNVLSVGMNEFYVGQQAGYNPSITFEIADYEDYSGQQFIRYNGVLYKVIRTYRKSIMLEIVCQYYEE